jgi:hypothetical protein
MNADSALLECKTASRQEARTTIGCDVAGTWTARVFPTRRRLQGDQMDPLIDDVVNGDRLWQLVSTRSRRDHEADYETRGRGDS